MARLDDASFDDRITVNPGPGLGARVDRAGGAVSPAQGMVRVCRRQQDGGGTQPSKSTEPICAAVEHDANLLALHQQGAVPVMAGGAHLDLASGSEKPEMQLLVGQTNFSSLTLPHICRTGGGLGSPRQSTVPIGRWAPIGLVDLAQCPRRVA